MGISRAESSVNLKRRHACTNDLPRSQAVRYSPRPCRWGPSPRRTRGAEVRRRPADNRRAVRRRKAANPGARAVSLNVEAVRAPAAHQEQRRRRRKGLARRRPLRSAARLTPAVRRVPEQQVRRRWPMRRAIRANRGRPEHPERPHLRRATPSRPAAVPTVPPARRPARTIR